eukprot:gene14943-17137_t
MEPIAEESPQKLIPTPPVAADLALKRESRPLTMPQKQFNLLTQAFKGSASHVPSPHESEPNNSITAFDTPPYLALSILKESVDADIGSVVPAEPTEAEKQEKRLQELLQSIAFHTHSDQSISTIDVKVHAERQWLSNNPSTETWSEITERVLQNRQEEQALELARENEIADRFLDSVMLTGAMHVNNLLSGADNEKERLVVRLVFSLLNDTVDEIMAEVAAEVAQLATKASTILNKSLVKSLASVSLGTERSNSRFWKMSGREQVLKGALLDALRVPTRPPPTAVTSEAATAGTRNTEYIDSNGTSTVTRSTLHTDSKSNNKNEIRTIQPRLQIPNNTNTSAASVPPVHSQPLPVPPPLCDKIVHIPSMLPSTLEVTELSGNGYDSDDSEFEAPLNNNTGAGTANSENTTTSKHYVQELYDIEMSHWKGINFTSVINSPVQIPSTVATPNKYMSNYTNSSVKGVVTCMRLFPLAHALYTSLLVCGLCNGRIIVYSVRYTGEPAEILCTSVLPNKAEQAPIVDIKCGSSGVSSLVCMNSLGVVSVLHVNTALCTTTPTALQPVARKKWTLFRYKSAPKNNTMASIHSINSNDLIFTLPTLQETLSMSASDTQDLSNLTEDSLTTGTTSNNTTKPSNTNALNILPTSICFHPSVTLFGSNVSFMVGASNGDVIKYNYDYIHNTLASPIINTTPFVSKEFIHPNNAVKGFVLTNGVNEKLGNKVYRELFHYHKSKIVLLDVVNAISPYLLSVDQTGRVALWHYDSKYFEGKCWFRPYSTTKLALDMVDLLPAGDINMYGGSKTVPTTFTDDGATTEPLDSNNMQLNVVPLDKLIVSEDIMTKLVARDAYKDNNDTNSVGDGAEDRVCLVYEPIYDNERGVYVQYTAVEYTTNIEPDTMITAADVGLSAIKHANNSVAVRQDSVPVVSSEAIETIGNPATAPVASSNVGNNDDTNPTVPENNNVEAEASNADAEASEYAALLLSDVDPVPSATGTIDAAAVDETNLTDNNNTSSNSNDDINNTETMVGDGIRVTTASSDLIEDSPTTPTAEAEVTTVAGDNVAVAESVSLETTVEANAAEVPVTHSSGELDTLPQEVTSNAEEVKPQRIEEVALNDAAESPAEVAPPSLSVDTADIKSNKDENSGLIPVTIFTALTALIEQYREQKNVLADSEQAEDEDEMDKPADRNDHSNIIKSATTPSVPTNGTLPLPVPTRLPSTSANAIATTHILPATPRASIVPVAPTTKRVREFISAEIFAERTLNFTIMSCKMTYDGAEVVMLLASRVENNNSSGNLNESDTISNNTTGIHTVYYFVPYFPLTQKFHRFYPRLYMNSTDSVVDYCVGPLQFETLTRTVFVLTKKCVRLFSLHTGREIITTNSNITSSPSNSADNKDATNANESTSTPVPFVWALPSFAPTTIALCPSQRVLTLSAHDDTRVAVFLLQHSNDGGATLHTTESAELLNRFKLYEKIRPAEKTVLPAAEGTGIHTVLNILTFIPPELQYVTDEANEIIDLVFDHVWHCIEISQDRKHRKGLIDTLYGAKGGMNDNNSDVNLGFIEPTVWPPLQEFPELKISAEEE